MSLTTLAIENDTAAASLATLHAQHIFDWDSVRAGQYYYLLKNTSAAPNATIFLVRTYMPNTTASQGMALMAPWLNASLEIPGISLVSQQYTYADVNDILFAPDDSVGVSLVEGSRLVPEKLYRDSPETVGEVYKKLLDGGASM